MHPIQSPNLPTVATGYTPYFYEAGLHQAYPLQAENVPPRAQQRYQEANDSSALDALFRRADQTQTVEQVIAHGYFSVPNGQDETTAIIADKQHTSRLGLDDLIDQVRRRHEIYTSNLEQIERAKCAAMNAIYSHEAYEGPASSKQHYARHKAIQDLYSEQREERITLWKDVSRLRQSLPETAQLYLAAHRKMTILDSEAGGHL